MARPKIVVDTETGGLTPAEHPLTEIAAVNLQTGQVLSAFRPLYDCELEVCEPEALELNHYWATVEHVGDFRRARAEFDARFVELMTWLHGATMLAVNPMFDAAVLEAHSSRLGLPRGAGIRTLAVESLFFGAAGLDVLRDDVPGLSRMCELTGTRVRPEHRHTALGDALVTAEIVRWCSATRERGRPRRVSHGELAVEGREVVEVELYLYLDAVDPDAEAVLREQDGVMTSRLRAPRCTACDELMVEGHAGGKCFRCADGFVAL